MLPGGPTAVVPPRSHPEDESRTREAGAPRDPGHHAAGGAGQADGRARTPLVTGTHGKTTTTSMLIVACSSTADLILRSRSAATWEAAPMRITAVATALWPRPTRVTARCSSTPRCRGGHQHRGRSPDFFGDPSAYTAVFDRFVERLAPGARAGGVRRRPRCAELAERSAAKGVRVLRYGSSASCADGLAGAPVGWEQHGTGAIAHIELAGESGSRVMNLAVLAGIWRQRAGRGAGRRRCGAPIDGALEGPSGFEGVRRDSSWWVRPTAFGCRRLCASSGPRFGPHRTALHTIAAQESGPQHRRVPAALVFPDKDFRA